MRANWEKLKEGSNMCEALKELFADDFKESELNKEKVEKYLKRKMQ